MTTNDIIFLLTHILEKDNTPNFDTSSKKGKKKIPKVFKVPCDIKQKRAISKFLCADHFASYSHISYFICLSFRLHDICGKLEGWTLKP